MARKIKFALEMKDGVKIRGNIEELREHFDLEKVIGYFLSGKLIEWLEDRYYDDEAEKIAGLDKDSPDFRAQLCEILGVNYDDGNNLDVAALERLNEKKNFLRQKTDDKSIVDNAAITALNQEDLSDLLDLDEPTIYLCGESFNIPIRVENKRYIGILGTPKVNIAAKSPLEFYAKGIRFENVILPFTSVVNETPVTITVESDVSVDDNDDEFDSESVLSKKELKQILMDSKNNYDDDDLGGVWHLFGGYRGSREDDGTLDDLKRKIALRLICKNQYKEKDIIRIIVDEAVSYGWAFTKDSFCIGGQWDYEGSETIIIPYESIIKVDTTVTGSKFYLTYDSGNGENTVMLRYTWGRYQDWDFRRLEKYLKAVRSFY